MRVLVLIQGMQWASEVSGAIFGFLTHGALEPCHGARLHKTTIDSGHHVT